MDPLFVRNVSSYSHFFVIDKSVTQGYNCFFVNSVATRFTVGAAIAVAHFIPTYVTHPFFFCYVSSIG